MQKGANTFIAQHAYKKLAVGPKGLHGFSFLYEVSLLSILLHTALCS